MLYKENNSECPVRLLARILGFQSGEESSILSRGIYIVTQIERIKDRTRSSSMVERLVWDQEAAGSSPASSTLHMDPEPSAKG